MSQAVIDTRSRYGSPAAPALRDTGNDARRNSRGRGARGSRQGRCGRAYANRSGIDRRPRGRAGPHHPGAGRILHHAGLPRRVRTLDARGRGAHVPRRGAAASPGHGDHRCADRGQDRCVGLGRAPRALELAAGQRLHMGAAADRQGARRGGGRRGRSAARSGQAPRRAGHPRRGCAGDARARAPVRARA